MRSQRERATSECDVNAQSIGGEREAQEERGCLRLGQPFASLWPAAPAVQRYLRGWEVVHRYGVEFDLGVMMRVMAAANFRKSSNRPWIISNTHSQSTWS